MVTSYVRGTEEEVNTFMKHVYNKPMSEKMETIKLTEKGKFKFPWGLTQKVFDLEAIYREEPVDKSTYLVKLEGDFFLGSKEDIDNCPEALSKVSIKVSEEDQLYLNKKAKFEALSKTWKKAVGKVNKVKKFWNKKVLAK
jgi:hypothetical protein